MNKLQQAPQRPDSGTIEPAAVSDERAQLLKRTALWRAVDRTDPAFTKHVNQRGGFTAIDPTYQARKATEQFGPFGIGWGFESSEFDASLVESTGMVMHRAVFFYVYKGERGTFPIHNAISIWSDGKRTRPDEDFAKKVETNTLSKALSRLGVCADVFMGKFDDMRYVEYAAHEAAIDAAENSAEEMAELKNEFSTWINKEVEGIKLAPNERAAKLIAEGLKPRAVAKGQRFGFAADKINQRIDAVLADHIAALTQPRTA